MRRWAQRDWKLAELFLHRSSASYNREQIWLCVQQLYDTRVNLGQNRGSDLPLGGA